MHSRLRIIAVGALFAAGAVGSVVGGASIAHAAPVAVPGCAGDTSGVTVNVDDGQFANGAMVPIHDNRAATLYPAATDSSMSSPICGARRLADGSFQREWLYCTAHNLNTCATAPLVRKGNAATGVAALTDLDKARLAWIVENEVDSSTGTTRIRSARLIWCVTEGAAANAEAPGYYRNGTDTALSCPNWPAIDPTLKLRPTLAMTGPAGTVAAGATARFALSTDSSPITLTGDGLTGLALCPGASGATLTGGTLTIAAPDAAVPMPLCATRATAGTGTLRAVLALRTGSTLEFWQRVANTQFCQGMLSSETLSADAVAASVSVTFAVDVVTTTSTSTTPPRVTDPTTTTTDGHGGGGATTSVVLDTVSVNPSGSASTLPRTGGGGSRDGAYWALVLLLAGVCLAAFGWRGGEQSRR